VITTPTDYTPATGETLTIIRDVPFTQTLDANALTTLPASSIEDAYDKIWMALTQLKEVTSRAYVSSETGAGGAPDLTAWSPVLAIATDGARRVFQVVDWTGGDGDTPDTGDYVGSSGLVASIGDGVDVRGPQGLSGNGSGDMLAANNLSDVASAATAFAAIKQAATTTATGVVELATDAETLAKSDTARALTPSNLAAFFIDEDSFATDSATRVPSQQSVKAYVDANAGAFDAGTVMLFVQTAAPTGWTKSVTHNDKALRVVSGAVSSGGSVNFSTLFARTGTDAVTLIANNLPSNTLMNTGSDSSLNLLQAGEGGNAVAAGSGTSFTPAIDCRVKYVDVILASKD
jgi:hypothetical protein